MKIVRIISIMVLAVVAGLLIVSCGSAEDKLIGTWTTESVSTRVDSSNANLQSIDHTIASTKTTRFILNEDHSMSLSIDGYTTDAFWTYNSDNDRISFRLEADAMDDAIELGKMDGDKIKYVSSVKHGTITVFYIKE
ncbi:MAG: hypothetical protein DRI97_00535 [Bacteroidetes bacterium]|nr:MAG: hypothetical protein DRI83_10385 [Bacteroidota bacterium]RLD59658.1 MAG: hypothetical protein DRI97_00535 [Bacteroidota bacterium]RLD82799.1 MAG: hypothetical protein DRJ15_00395 [Bacteroidota bacterium]